jgi:DNA-binding NtrC family response regulator
VATENAGFPILYVDDEEDNLAAFDLTFGQDFELLVAGHGASALDILRSRPVAVLVADQRMPGMTGIELLVKAREVQPDSVGILLTAYRDIEVIIEALNSGHVHRYVQKPWEARELAVILRQAVDLYRVREENRTLHRRLEELNAYLGREVEAQYNFGELVGSSAKLAAVVDTVRKVATTSSTVLLIGESGTGKELVARAIHNNSLRKDQPFVRVNLAALAPTLIESELFGHERGAFTGAVSRKMGRFELAHRGTLFLDEIGDLPPDLQVKLLRVLQEREFERVGGNRTLPVDVRIIAATNRDLDAEVQAGRLREDLYYRVNVFPIRLPPLRDRKEDIPELAASFLRRFAPRVGKTFQGIAPGAMAQLAAYDWPGNVRELENAVERAMILSAGPQLSERDFAFVIEPPAAATPRTGGLPQMLDGIERQQLKDALERNGHSISAVARDLGINRTTLYYRLKKHGLIE